ncbi:MAG: hypothetical protein DI498_10870 [Paracoccus denitrificans]|nr:MAG: hypothetical protein DI498_10870 [Paracoccus denitrificans]PZO83645.1 MAG: hypothetical protein DI633_10870 [Paracoccus denitrificans]
MSISFWAGRGRTVDLMNVQPHDVAMSDLGEALARLNRFSGRTSETWSVAAHSVLVERLCPPELGPWALLHDAHETFLGDVTSPAVDFIARVGRVPQLHDGIAMAKGRLDRAIGAAWGVAVRSVNGSLRRADRIALQAEAIMFLDAQPVLFEPNDDEDIDRAITLLREMPLGRGWRTDCDLWIARVEHYSHLGWMTPPSAIQPAAYSAAVFPKEH